VTPSRSYRGHLARGRGPPRRRSYPVESLKKLDYAGQKVEPAERPPLPLRLRIALALATALGAIAFVAAFLWWGLRWSIFGGYGDT
jgi:hypothetical protein